MKTFLCLICFISTLFAMSPISGTGYSFFVSGKEWQCYPDCELSAPYSVSIEGNFINPGSIILSTSYSPMKCRGHTTHPDFSSMGANSLQKVGDSLWRGVDSKGDPRCLSITPYQIAYLTRPSTDCPRGPPFRDSCAIQDSNGANNTQIIIVLQENLPGSPTRYYPVTSTKWFGQYYEITSDRMVNTSATFTIDQSNGNIDIFLAPTIWFMREPPFAPVAEFKAQTVQFRYVKNKESPGLFEASGYTFVWTKTTFAYVNKGGPVYPYVPMFEIGQKVILANNK